MTVKSKFYLHSSKDDNAFTGSELGLCGAAFQAFRYCGYEVEMDIEVNEATGHAVATHVKGVKLERPIELN